MKKISTLALALIAMGTLSMPASAQVKFEPVSSIDASGWYQMRQVTSVQNKAVTSTSPKYVFSKETKGYSWFGTSDTQKEDATAFIYIDKGATNYGIQNINGKWGKNKAEATDTRSGMEIKMVSAENKTFTVGGYWDDYNTGVMGGFGSSSTATFQFSKVSDEALAAYDVYTVEINGDITTGSVSSTIEANKGTKTVYPGGSFFFTAGTELEVSNFTAPDVANCNKVISIDRDNKKVSVTYTYQLAALVEQAKEAISHTSAGYPLEGSESRTNLQNAINAASGTGDDQTKFTNLNDALTAYKNDKTVKMPENGKVYVLTNVQLDGTCNHFSYSTGRLTTVKDKTKAAKFMCRVVNGKYVFVNVEDGKYLIVVGNTFGYNNKKGYITEYDTQWADLTVSKNNIFSCFNIAGKVSEKKESYFLIKTNGGFEGWDTSENNAAVHTTAFKFEEVSYPNTIAFNAVSDVEGVSNLATFSAPFATVVPEGVTAYYVSTADNTKATMKAIEAGRAIPANAGVILTSTTGDKATMIPATTETAAELTGNKLGNSAGADKTIAEGDNAYILANGANGTAFYKGKIGSTLKANKAYLTLNEAGAPEAISMNFGGNVTGINQIVNAEQNNAPVYDLTGRRVVRTVKGGLYIKGGNKFIAR
ncbi:hypothetical protein [uncultured Prevotellamassilia sp.]|uniref:hypothetical protein n=1 Tax=uncultured Prevotellamassilia sp. TaxID=1926676 RepID=UPI00258D94F8|nr:hypothetical protein [uncultured Prevotellamassilia sp.]